MTIPTFDIQAAIQTLRDPHKCGIKNILIACVDDLKGFPEAIERIYPKTEVQHGIVHQIRNSFKCIASKNQKAFMIDLKYIQSHDLKYPDYV